MAFNFKHDWPIIAAVAAAGVGVLLMGGRGGGSSSPTAGESNAQLAAQTQDNALGAQLQEAQDTLTAQQQQLNAQNQGTMFQGILTWLADMTTSQQQNKTAITELHMTDQNNLLLARAQDATARAVNANNNKTTIASTNITANLEQELQAAQTQLQEYELYIEEMLTGNLHMVGLPGSGGNWSPPIFGPIGTSGGGTGSYGGTLVPYGA